MAHRDRLSGLDAAFLAPRVARRAHARRGDLPVRGRGRRRYDELVERDRRAPARRAPLPPEARARAARPGPPAVDRRPALQPALPRAPQRAARPGRRRTSSSASRAASSPSPSTARSRCGRSEPRRGPRAGGGRHAALRDHPRPTTRSWTASPAWTSPRSSSTRPPTRRRRAAAGTPVDRAPRADRRRAARALPGRARHRPGRGPRAVLHASRAPRARRPAHRRRPRGPRGDGPRGPRPRARHAAERRRSARTGGTRGSTPPSTSSRRSSTPSAARVNDVVLSAVALALGRWLRGRGVATEGLVLQGDGAGVGPRRRRAGRARQPRRRDVGAAAGRRSRTRRPSTPRSTRRCRA